MRPFITTLVVLASIPSDVQAQPEAPRFACEGAGKAEGYPYGVQEIDRRRFRILDDVRHPAVFDLDPAEANICLTGADCSVSDTDNTLHFVVSEIPNHDPIYVRRFRFDRRTLLFETSGGGLDGGWSVSGTCKAEPAAEH